MFEYEQKIEQAQKQAYWKRNAPLTCVVLASAVVLSTFFKPLSWQTTAALFLSACILFAAEAFFKKHHDWAGIICILLALGSGALGIRFSDFDQNLFWIQGVGLFLTFFLGLGWFSDEIRKRKAASSPD